MSSQRHSNKYTVGTIFLAAKDTVMTNQAEPANRQARAKPTGPVRCAVPDIARQPGGNTVSRAMLHERPDHDMAASDTEPMTEIREVRHLGHAAPGLARQYIRPGIQRRRDAIRVIPIPPVLVAILRDHVERFGTAEDGRLFQVTWGQRDKGGVVSAKVYGQVWQKARAAALTRAQHSSPLAGRPYDLRHGGVTLALNAGVPAPEVASRAGHSVEVLWRVYAGCIYGHDQLWNRRIDEALIDDEGAGSEPPDDPAG
jgi:hypothetical protein